MGGKPAIDRQARKATMPTTGSDVAMGELLLGPGTAITGGDASLLAGTGPAGAGTLAERCRSRVDAERIPHARAASSSHVTVSIGGALLEIPPNSDSGQAAAEGLKRADEALYRAKNKGRNRVVSDEGDAAAANG